MFPQLTLSQLKKLIADLQYVPIDAIHDRSRLVDDLGFDSLEMQSLLLALEEQYGLIPMHDVIARVVTLRDLAKALAVDNKDDAQC
jgi:acyl carrier protein